jgi:CRISPR-associated protein (TIGR03986 family)
MSSPKHVNPGGRNRVAHAPYNFVPLPDEIKTIDKPRDHDCYHADLLTGRFTCTLTTASPLYVRAARTLTQYNRKNNKGESDPETPSDFFYGEDEKLLIPGSSLRGMLRNMVEIVSSARVEPVTSKPLFFRTLDDTSLGRAYGPRMTAGNPSETGYYPLARAGYMELHESGYYIRPAKTIEETQFYRVEEKAAQKVFPKLRNMAHQNDKGGWSPEKPYKWMRETVWFRPVKPTSHLPESPAFYAEVTELNTGNEKPDGGGWVKGWFIASGWVPSRKGRGKRRHWLIAPPEETDANLIYVEDEDIDLYQEYGGGISQTVDRQKMSVLSRKKGEQIPCFYTLWQDNEGKQRVAFGHTAMFRLPYEHTPADLISKSLRDVDGTDMAQAIFGIVPSGKQGRDTIAGRVFITDASLNGDAKDALMPEVVLSTQALSSPKPTTIQHYLIQGNPNNPNELFHYDSEAGKETTLRGSKLYWHQGDSQALDRAMKPRKLEDGSEDPKDRSSFKPVKIGTSFTFNIHFENLRPGELGALLWVLEKASDDKYRLKLGMGKPYGLGSVAITHALTLTDRARRYEKFFEGDKWNEGTLNDGVKAEKLGASKQSFAKFLCGDASASVDALPRIQEFLCLLNWVNHPGKDDTKYMELGEFTGDRNPNKNPLGLGKRPVLPTPGFVAGNKKATLPPTATTGGGGTGLARRAPSRANEAPAPGPLPARFVPSVPAPRQAPPAPRERPRPQAKKPTLAEKPPAQLKPGDVIWATVDLVEGKKVSLTPKVGGEDAICIMADKGLNRFKENDEVLIVVDKVEKEPNNWLIECSPWD